MKSSYQNNPSEVLDKLLEYHDITKLRALLNKKGRRQKTRSNNYIDVATDVYKLVHNEHYMLERAINKIATERSISDKTIKNHLRKFRKLFKDGISDKGGSDKEQTTQLIKELILSKYDWESDDFYDMNDEKYVKDFINKKYKNSQFTPRYFPF